ncbi:P-II family regulatory protein [Planctomycetales bacterium]|nr:P-II family regulatory protein [Planctomycetales bacterium]GHT35661.1 P-II family regulatory protein [Planctomycetales bacterium]
MDSMKLIVTIVNKGKGEQVAQTACNAGARGGTVIPGHGLAVKLMLGISIEPEKEIVLTVINEEQVQTIQEAILKEIDLTQPNKGISFVVPLDSVIGIAKSEN